MTRELTPLEVLQVAAEMERHAARFYRRAAGMYHDPHLSKLFSELAQWEKRHVQIFTGMKDRLSESDGESGRFDLGRVDAGRLDVPSAVFHQNSEPAQELTGTATRVEVLRLALKKERYTIGYYTSLTEFALGPDNLRVIRDIIREEQQHVRILTQSLHQSADT
jgi:rubrerythrin